MYLELQGLNTNADVGLEVLKKFRNKNIFLILGIQMASNTGGGEFCIRL